MTDSPIHSSDDSGPERAGPDDSGAPESRPPVGSGVRIGIDTGGTFTDLAVLAEGQSLVTLKVASTPDDPSKAILAGLEALGVEVAAGSQPESGATAAIIHGTTVALNALLTRTGTDGAALVTNRGFVDLIEIDRQTRPDLYALEPIRPAPLVPRERRFEIGQRTEPATDGASIGGHDVIETLRPTDDEIEGVVRAVLASGASSVAVCLLHSYADPEPELRIANALRAAGLDATASSALVAEYREAERFSTAVVNAALVPPMRSYLERLGAALPSVPLEILQSSGGTLDARTAAHEPARVLLSGPAGGVVGAAVSAESIGLHAIATLDMGGTSTDVGFHDASRGLGALGDEVRVGGCSIAVPTLDMHTIGCGGGSIARVDADGALRVGPKSAGAEPGPIAFGRGGTQPTVTDAYVMLGRIPHEPFDEGFLGGVLTLDVDATRAAFTDLGRALGASPIQAAEAVVATANASMRRALGVMTMQRGRDPESIPLVAFGGGGGLAAADLMLALRMPSALVPDSAGVLSAYGMTRAPRVIDRSSTLLCPLSRDSARRAATILTSLSTTARTQLNDSVDSNAERASNVERSLALRYQGQSYELSLALTGPAKPDSDKLAQRFHAAHEERFGWRLDDHVIEMVTARVRVSESAGSTAPQRFMIESPPADARLGQQRSWIDGQEGVVPVLARERLPVSEARGRASTSSEKNDVRVNDSGLNGPAIVVDSTSTTWVPPGVRAEVTRAGLLLTRVDF